MEIKAFPIELKQVEDREVSSLYSVSGKIDDAEDIIHPGAFAKTLAERMDRVKVLWQHNAEEPPVAVPVVLRELSLSELPLEFRMKYPTATGGLFGKVRYLDTQRGNEVLTGIREGAITENSIGFDCLPNKFDFSEVALPDGQKLSVRNIREVRLWDISPVNWGMQDAARVLAKAALPFRDTGIVEDQGTAWSAPTLSDFTDQQWDDLNDSEKRRIAAHYAWAAELPPASFGDLKLPHHRAGKSGVGPAIWRGVANAMARLPQTQLPSGDEAGVRAHLEKHYKQFGKDAPDGKTLFAFGALYTEIKTSGVIAARKV